jgi:hypothetical protein
MQWSQLQTVDVYRPGVGKRYSMLPVDHIDITGFHVDYDSSPLRPSLIDIHEGDRVGWRDKDAYYHAFVDEVVVDQLVLRVAFRDAQRVEQPADVW